MSAKRGSYERTPEIRKTLSEKAKARFALGFQNPMKGKPRPDLSERNRRANATRSPEMVATVVERMAVANRGHALREDHKKKIGAALAGRKFSIATRRKLSAAALQPKERARRSRQAAINNERMQKGNTKPELLVRELLLIRGVSFDQQFSIAGYPFVFDFAIPSRKLLIEADGCYWHGCPACKEPGKPDTVRNDRRKNGIARREGWRLIRIRACSLGKP